MVSPSAWSALLEGRKIEEAVARGNRIGGLAIQVIGDSEGLPTRSQLDALERGAAATGSTQVTNEAGKVSETLH